MAIFDGRDKTVAPLGERFDEAWDLSRVSEGLPQPVDGLIQAAVEINKSVCAPKPPLQLLPGHHLPGPFQQERQDLKGLIPKLDLQTALAQFSASKVNF